MTKQELRQYIRQEKATHNEEMERWSHAICETIAKHPLWERSQCVLLYHALPDEPQLGALYDLALSAGKTVLLPVVDGDDLVLKRYEGADSLQEGAFHIMEPTGETFPINRYAEIDWVLVPGMAFDGCGHRLGRGKGYYDRLLPRLSKAHKTGVCFPFQLLESIPCEAHDVVMDEVLTL